MPFSANATPLHVEPTSSGGVSAVTRCVILPGAASIRVLMGMTNPLSAYAPAAVITRSVIAIEKMARMRFIVVDVPFLSDR